MRAPALLVLHPRTTTGNLLRESAERRGFHVTGSPPDGKAGGQDNARNAHGPWHWYGGPLAADRIAAPLGIGLLEPADDWLTVLPPAFTGRRVELTTLAEAWKLTGPAFVKPPSDKSVPAAVYENGGRLPRSGARIGPDTPVLVSGVVAFGAEYRLFVLDGKVVTGSRYAVHGRVDPAPLTAGARRFAARLLAEAAGTLPSAVVVDIGELADGRGWAVVEANMAWFAHSYASDPGGVLDVVLRAAGARAKVAERDLRFLRPAPAPHGDQEPAQTFRGN